MSYVKCKVVNTRLYSLTNLGCSIGDSLKSDCSPLDLSYIFKAPSHRVSDFATPMPPKYGGMHFNPVTISCYCNHIQGTVNELSFSKVKNRIFKNIFSIF